MPVSVSLSFTRWGWMQRSSSTLLVVLCPVCARPHDHPSLPESLRPRVATSRVHSLLSILCGKHLHVQSHHTSSSNSANGDFAPARIPDVFSTTFSFDHIFFPAPARIVSYFRYCKQQYCARYVLLYQQEFYPQRPS